MHQIQSDVQDNAYIQLNLADVIEAITKYGTSPEILTLMLKTPSNQIHYFSDDEIVRYQINRIGEIPKARAFETQPSGDAILSPLAIEKLLESLGGN